MVEGFALLLFAELIGECLRQIFNLPVPGPVIGMFLVAFAMIVRARIRPTAAVSERSPIERTADALIGHMGLLFVPAGVGIVAIAPMLEGAWLPLGVALLLSTIVTLIVTGAVMHAITRHTDGRSARTPSPGRREP